MNIYLVKRKEKEIMNWQDEYEAFVVRATSFDEAFETTTTIETFGRWPVKRDDVDITKIGTTPWEEEDEEPHIILGSFIAG
jgi:hypothetical protein